MFSASSMVSGSFTFRVSGNEKASTPPNIDMLPKSSKGRDSKYLSWNQPKCREIRINECWNCLNWLLHNY
jgi:hypothetical protein